MRAVISFLLAIVAVIVGFAILIVAAFGGGTLLIPYVLIFVVIVLIVKAMLGRAPAKIIVLSNPTDPTHAIELKSQEKMHEKRVLQVAYGAGLGVMSFYVFLSAQFAVVGSIGWGNILLFAPVYLINIIGVITLSILLYRESQTADWIDNSRQKERNRKLKTFVSVFMLFSVFVWIWVSTAVPGYFRSHDDDTRITAQLTAIKEAEDKEKAEKAALKDAEWQKKIDSSNLRKQTETDRLATELNASVLSPKWNKVATNSTPRLGLEYPDKWGTPKISEDIKTGEGFGDESFMIDFSGVKTPVIFIFKGSLSLGKSVTSRDANSNAFYRNVVGYTYLPIEETQHRLTIQLKTSEYPELCQAREDGSNCYAGEFAADFNKVTSSIKIYE